MTEEPRWSLDRDPPRDEALGRLMRLGGAPVPAEAVNWEGLSRSIMRRAKAARSSGPAPSPYWWDAVAQWGRVAAVASLAALLATGILLSQGSSSSAEQEATASLPPESVAIARVVAAFPDDAVLTSLVQTEHRDEFTSWGTK
jgi:hypothetical protein